ncbi:hypothetical protein KP509_21G080200 [Ceratopteris richardii]|uniref:OTU domain-containing protein n=1 Tax=Ceratopteris richardii TaxID=49495 RepID=A0A8T2SDN8_CERRI|nr:hypothetical protein KP509_21G080200 [Ceratopteris richardii]
MRRAASMTDGVYDGVGEGFSACSKNEALGRKSCIERNKSGDTYVLFQQPEKCHKISVLDSYDEDESIAQALQEEVTVDDEAIARALQEQMRLGDDTIKRTTQDQSDWDEVEHAAHVRLIQRLEYYGLKDVKVQGDGNCQFRAISDQLYGTVAHHKSVRNDVSTQLRRHPEYYEGYVSMKYTDYANMMEISGEWGDHLTLQAAADYYRVRIWLLTSFEDTPFIQISPKQEKSPAQAIYLSFCSEAHYNSLYDNANSGEDDAPDHTTKGQPKKKSRRQQKKKKKSSGKH